MDVRRLAMTGAVLLAAGSAAVAQPTPHWKMPPGPDAYIADQTASLNALDASLSGVKGKKPLFAGVLHLAWGGIVEHVPIEVLNAYTDQLKQAGVERVDIYTIQSAWPDKIPADIAKYDAVVAHIRQVGLKLGFDPTIDARAAGAGYAAWKPDAIAGYVEMARRYQPDKFSVMHEPTAQDMNLKEKVSPATWAAFAAEACAAVTAVSPHTVCTVALLPFERPEFDALVKVPAIKSIGFDIFGMDGDIVNYDSQGLTRQIEEVDAMTKIARAAGKSVHIAETGREIWDYMPEIDHTGTNGYEAYNTGDPRYMQLDEHWYATMAHYAAARRFDTIQMFRTFTFFVYSPPGTDSRLFSPGYVKGLVDAIVAHKHTGMFDTYRRVADSYKR